MVKVSVNGPFQNLVTKVWTFKMSSFPDHNDACFIQRLKEATKLWQMCAAELAIKRSVDTHNFMVQCDFNVLTWTISQCDAISMYWHVQFHDAMRFQCVDMNDFTMRCDFNVLTCTISRCNVISMYLPELFHDAISMCWHVWFHNAISMCWRRYLGRSSAIIQNLDQIGLWKILNRLSISLYSSHKASFVQLDVTSIIRMGNASIVLLTVQGQPHNLLS